MSLQNKAKRQELPHGHWLRSGSQMFRVVENTIGGHIVETKPAPRRQRRRDDKRQIDESQGSGV